MKASHAHLIVVPRWSGTADSDWYPWLREESSGANRFSSLEPDPDAPEISASLSELSKEVKRCSSSSVVLVGHSVGCQVVLRYLLDAPAPTVTGAVLVAGWFDVDETWPEIVPWITTELPPGQPAVPIHVLLSDNDPFTADFETTRAKWKDRGARVTIHHSAAHFNTTPNDIVLDAIRDTTAIR